MDPSRNPKAVPIRQSSPRYRYILTAPQSRLEHAVLFTPSHNASHHHLAYSSLDSNTLFRNRSSSAHYSIAQPQSAQDHFVLTQPHSISEELHRGLSHNASARQKPSSSLHPLITTSIPDHILHIRPSHNASLHSIAYLSLHSHTSLALSPFNPPFNQPASITPYTITLTKKYYVCKLICINNI